MACVAGLGFSNLQCYTCSLTGSVRDIATGQMLSCWPFLLVESTVWIVLTGMGSAPLCTGRASFHRAEKLPTLMAWPLLGAACCEPGCHSPPPFLPWFSSLLAVTVPHIVLCFWSVSRILKRIIFVHFVQFLNCLLNMTALGSMAVSWKSWLCYFFCLFFCFYSENKMLHQDELNLANPLLYHNIFLLPVTIFLCQSWELWFLLSFCQYLGPLSSKTGNSGVTLKLLYNSHVTYNYCRQLSERPHITVISFLYPPGHLVSH